jgi:hypothetical protein
MSKEEIPITETVDSLKSELSTRTKDLFFPSEADIPIEFITLEKTSDITATLKKMHPDKANQISETDLAEFYNMYGVEKDWQNNIQKQFARRFGAALDLLKDNTENLKVYRIGGVRLDIYIIGEFRDGRFVGLKTGAVET